VLDDGILERGVVGLYLPEFDLEKSVDDYFTSAEWKGIIGKWEGTFAPWSTEGHAAPALLIGALPCGRVRHHANCRSR
jgi:hypothetical protein